jgi:hypothetical protein
MAELRRSSPAKAKDDAECPASLQPTSLKWGSDGELSELDLQRILGLLTQVDPVAEALMAPPNDASS